MGFLKGTHYSIFLMVSVSKQKGPSMASSFYGYEIFVETVVSLIRFSIEFSIWTIIFGTLVANSRLLPCMDTSIRCEQSGSCDNRQVTS